MTTLGQQLRNNDEVRRLNGQYTSEEVAQREADRAEAIRASFARVTAKAKADIVKCISKGRPMGDIKSHVPKREEAYRHLHRMRFVPQDTVACQAAKPMWDAFIAWAKSEELDIRLQQCSA